MTIYTPLQKNPNQTVDTFPRVATPFQRLGVPSPHHGCASPGWTYQRSPPTSSPSDMATSLTFGGASSPLKIGRNCPKKEAKHRLPTFHFQVRFVSFRECGMCFCLELILELELILKMSECKRKSEVPIFPPQKNCKLWRFNISLEDLERFLYPKWITKTNYESTQLIDGDGLCFCLKTFLQILNYEPPPPPPPTTTTTTTAATTTTTTTTPATTTTRDWWVIAIYGITLLSYVFIGLKVILIPFMVKTLHQLVWTSQTYIHINIIFIY